MTEPRGKRATLIVVAVVGLVFLGSGLAALGLAENRPLALFLGIVDLASGAGLYYRSRPLLTRRRG